MIQTIHPKIIKEVSYDNCNTESLTDSNTTSIYNIYKDNSKQVLLESYSSILDYKETTPPKEICEESKERYAICSDCQAVYQITTTCHKRTCQACQSKRAKSLFVKYVPIVQYWIPDEDMKIQFLTVTIKNQTDISKAWIESMDHKLELFLRRLRSKGQIFEYGFINKECTHSEKNGYHYHYHILFYGSTINLKDDKFNLSKIWKDITKDSYIVKLYSDFKDGTHSLRYLLKYVCKTQETTPGMQKYYDATKGMKYFRTFGVNYKHNLVKEKSYLLTELIDKRLIVQYKNYYQIKKGLELERESVVAFTDKDYNSRQLYLFIKENENYIYQKKIVDKLPIRCSECYGQFERNRYDFSSILFKKENLSKDVDITKFKLLSYKKLRIYRDREIEQLLEISGTQLKICEDKEYIKTYLDRVKESIEKYLDNKYNIEEIEKIISQKNIEYLLMSGYIYQYDPLTYKKS